MAQIISGTEYSVPHLKWGFMAAQLLKTQGVTTVARGSSNDRSVEYNHPQFMTKVNAQPTKSSYPIHANIYLKKRMHYLRR